MKYFYMLLFLLCHSMAKAQLTRIQTIKCDADSSQSYCISIPLNYDKGHKYAVVFMFDPAAQGYRAVSQYPKAAANYGFILIASNNSRNGPMGTSLSAAEAMLTDALKKYAIDNDHVYLAGFSGGARVATTIAIQNSGVAGIIACSAGFAEPIPPVKPGWTFAGTTGSRDFNYMEMQETVKQLQATGCENNLQVFNGPHRWPPDDVFYSALLWSYLKRRREDATANDMLAKYRALTEALIAKNDVPTFKADLYRQYLSVAKDARFADELKVLEATQPYRDEQSRLIKLQAQENADQLELAKAIQLIVAKDNSQMRSKSWWKSQLARLNKMLISRAIIDSDYVVRQKAFVNANVSENFREYFDAQQYHTADEMLAVSEVFDPDNPIICYRRALLYAAEKDGDNTLYYLTQAKKKGFDNKIQMRNEPVFGFIKQSKVFMDLLK